MGGMVVRSTVRENQKNGRIKQNETVYIVRHVRHYNVDGSQYLDDYGNELPEYNGKYLGLTGKVTHVNKIEGELNTCTLIVDNLYELALAECYLVTAEEIRQSKWGQVQVRQPVITGRNSILQNTKAG